MSTTTNIYPLIDVDCNLWHVDLNKSLIDKQQLDNVPPFTILQEDAVEESNIIAMVSPSSTIQEAKYGLALLREASPLQPKLQILTTVGVHPYHVNDLQLQSQLLQTHYQDMKRLIQDNPTWVCSVGECGLDSSPGFPPLLDQIPWFQQQIILAQEMQLPLFVHERGAFDETMELLKDFTGKVLIHCFTGTKEQCAAYIQRGYYISISGYICKSDEAAAETRECIESGIITINRLMLETDAPYMGFAKCRQAYFDKNSDKLTTSKQRKKFQQGTYPNVPSSLPMVLDKVVQAFGNKMTHQEVAQQTTANAIHFFGFKSIV